MSIQLLSLALVGAVLYALLKKELPAMGVLFAAAVAAYLLVAFFDYLQTALEWVALLQEATGQAGFSALLKAAGIMICADFGRDLCKDAGSEAMATCIALAGRVMVLVASLPLLESVYLAILGLSQ